MLIITENNHFENNGKTIINLDNAITFYVHADQANNMLVLVMTPVAECMGDSLHIPLTKELDLSDGELVAAADKMTELIISNIVHDRKYISISSKTVIDHCKSK